VPVNWIGRVSGASLSNDRCVRPDLVVVTGVRLERTTQGCLTHDHNVVEALAPDRSDEPFNMAILPRRAWRGRMVPNPHGLQSATDDCPVRPVAIPKQMARCLIPGECLGDLVRDPFGSRVRGDVGPHRASPVQPHDHDAIEKLKAYGRHDEQVDRADVRRMVTEESLPGLRPPSPLLAMYLATVDCAT
jgi:hypothetical protein